MPLDPDLKLVVEEEPINPSPASRTPVLRGEHLWLVLGNLVALKQ